MTSEEQNDLHSLPTSTHLIKIPFPSQRIQTNLIAHLILFQGPSVLLWCGQCAEGWQDSINESQPSQQVSSISPLLIEQNNAPQASSRTTLPPLTGHLANEWAVAMTNARTKSTNSTSLYRSNADLAKPMSARLSKRFSIAQLLLSLSLPAEITSALEGPYSSSEGSKALLYIEGALSDILKQTLEPK